MKKVRVQFSDGSIAEIDENQLSAAQKAGGQLYVETSKPIARFKDGSQAELSDSQVEAARKAGAEIIMPTVKKKETSNTTGSVSQTGTVNTSLSNSPLQSPSVKDAPNPILDQFTTLPPAPKGLTPIQKAQAQLVSEENDIKSWIKNPNQNGVIIDTKKPLSSKYNNARIEVLNDMVGFQDMFGNTAGFMGANVSSQLDNPDSYPAMTTAIKQKYDRQIADAMDYTYDRFGEKKQDTGRDNPRSAQLRADRDRVLKNLSLLEDVAIVNKNPTATSEVIGELKLKSQDPIAYDNLKAAPNLTSVNYRKKQMGIDTKLAAEAMKIENGTATQDDVINARKLVSQREELVYQFPDIRKGQLREVIMERLSQGGQLGNVFSDETGKKALSEIDKMIASPLNSKDVPLLKKMRDDLDFGLGKNVLSNAFVGVPNAEQRYDEFLKEKGSYSGQSLVENFGNGFSSTFTETSKWLEGKVGLRSDAERLSEEDQQAVSSSKYVPKKYQVKVPEYTRNTKTGVVERNEDAGDFQLRAVPYKAASGAGQLASQLILGQVAGAAIAPAMRAIPAVTEAAGSLGMAANAGRAIGENVAKTVGNNLKVMMPAYAMSYDQNRKEALRQFGASPENGWKVDAYSTIASTLEGATELIGNPYEQFDMVKSAFRREVGSSINETISRLSIDEIQRMSRPQWQQAFEKIAKSALNGVAKGSKNLSGEASEEWVNAIGSYGAAALLGADMTGRDMYQEANDAFIDAAASMGFVGAIGAVKGYSSYYTRSGLYKQSLYDVSSNPDTYTDAINRKFAEGVLDESERDGKINMVNTAKAARNDWENIKQYAVNTKDATQRHKQSINYVDARTNELALQKELENTTSETAKKKLGEQIAKWQNVQSAIVETPMDFDTDGKPVLPSVSEQGMVEVRVSSIEELPEEIRDTAVETVSANGVPEVVAFVPNLDSAPVESESQPIEESPVVTLNEVMDIPVTYQGQRGVVSREGQIAVFKPEGQDTIIELGNIDGTENIEGIGTADISTLGIEQEQSVVMPLDNGNISVRGKEYVNNYSNPEMAINRDEEGNILSVSLETTGGAKRTFKGREAEDLAYQISLQAQEKKNKARKLAELAAWRDQQNNEISTAYEDNLTDPDAWVKPYQTAREQMDELVANMDAQPSTETSDAAPVTNEAIESIPNKPLQVLPISDGFIVVDGIGRGSRSYGRFKTEVEANEFIAKQSQPNQELQEDAPPVEVTAPAPVATEVAPIEQEATIGADGTGITTDGEQQLNDGGNNETTGAATEVVSENIEQPEGQNSESQTSGGTTENRPNDATGAAPVLATSNDANSRQKLIRKVLSGSIDPATYPTLFSSAENVESNQLAANTQGDKQGRVVDGKYVNALLSDLRESAFQNSKILETALGENWKEEVLSYIEEYPTDGNPANVVGILNILSTDTLNKINDANNGDTVASLRGFQNRIDRISIQVARNASLALNMRRVYGELAKGKPVSEIMAEQVLTDEQRQLIEDVSLVISEQLSDQEINSIPNNIPANDTKSSARKKKSENRQKKASRNKSKEQKEDIDQKASISSERINEQGEKVKMSFKQLAQIAKEKINKIKC